MSEKLHAQREEKLVTAIKGLGTGKHKVAEALKAKKIKGIPGDPEECAVAKLVKKLFPKAEVINIDGDRARVEFSDGDMVEVTLPKAVSSFIGDFDNEEKPELVAQ